MSMPGVQMSTFDLLKDLPLEVIGELSFMVAVSLAKRHIRGTIQLTDELVDAAANASWDAVQAHEACADA